ncbi:hypothetical protein [Paraburkholderia sp. 2C]|jgi:hypothetical protein
METRRAEARFARAAHRPNKREFTQTLKNLQARTHRSSLRQMLLQRYCACERSALKEAAAALIAGKQALSDALRAMRAKRFFAFRGHTVFFITVYFFARERYPRGARRASL